MKVSFLSLDENNNKVKFESDCSMDENEIIFIDKTVENTTIHLIKEEPNLKLIRDGNTNMEMIFSEGDLTKGYYKNQLGIEFEFYVSTKKLIIDKSKIFINYKMIIDENVQTEHKISILLY